MGESVNGRDGTWVSGAGTWDLKPRTQNLGPRSDYEPEQLCVSVVMSGDG